MCVVTDCMTLTRARIEVTIPRKRKGSCTDHDKVSKNKINYLISLCVCFLLLFFFFFYKINCKIHFCSFVCCLRACF